MAGCSYGMYWIGQQFSDGTAEIIEAFDTLEQAEERLYNWANAPTSYIVGCGSKAVHPGDTVKLHY